MILKQFEYSEFVNDERFWAIKPFELGRINLFTAKNATGKTRTLKAINLLTKMIKGNRFIYHANYAVVFSDNSENYTYIVNNDENVISEKLVGNTGILLQRDDTGTGEMFTEQFDRNIEFQLLGKMLAISRRDLKQYPYLEKIHLWAESVRYYSFGTSMKQEHGKALERNNTVFDGKSYNSVEVFFVGECEFENEFKERILASMNNIGYDINDIDVRSINEHSDDYILFASENDRNSIVDQHNMSQGMFRALSIIIHLTYHAMMGIPITILIDDVGEGLDFERSTKLIKLLIELAEKNDNIQLILSTNDRYVMNNVPLEYWQVIERKGGECNVFNYRNSKDKFDEFKYMGLNNFDFLATDYINSEWKKA
jgi:AAA15 family ATPase/GTPase